MNARIHILALVTLATLVTPRICRADGNELLKQCAPVVALMDDAGNFSSSTRKSHEMGFCVGIAQGITNLNLLYQYANMKTLFCLPTGGIQNGQAVRVIVKWLREHPERLHESEGVLAVSAFVDAYRCQPAR